MLEGWYCRTLANEQAAASQNNQDDDDSGSDESQEEGGEHFDTEIDYKTQYKYLKKKLKLLIYENEFFQNSLRSSQRRLLKVSRDKSFLLDRLLQYERPEGSSSESDETESSDEENTKIETKKRKIDNPGSSSNTGKNNSNGKKRKVVQPKIKQQQALQQTGPHSSTTQNQDGHMTAEEVERHLQSRITHTELVPERAPPTVPNEMFSNEPSLDRSNPNRVLSPTSVVSSEAEFAGFEDNNFKGEFVPLDELNQDAINNCFQNISLSCNVEFE